MIRWFVLILVFSTMPTGCARTNILALPRVINPTLELPLTGFSVLPPQDPGWIYLIERQDKLAMIKRGPGLDHTLSAIAMEYSVPDTIETAEAMMTYIIGRRLKGDKPDRFNFIIQEESPDPNNDLCARSYRKAEDHEAVKRSDIPFLIIETYGYACFHPKNRKIAYYFEYSEMAPPGKIGQDLPDRADAFLKGIKTWSPEDEVFWQAYAEYRKGNARDSFPKLLSLAQEGHTLAEALVGWMLANGQGIPTNHRQAVVWFERAAAKGNLTALMRLGYAYSEGLGVPEDDQKGRSFYQIAAEQNETGAQYDLGIMYYYGEGAPRNYSEAERWFLRAAEYGYPPAAYMLGQMNYKGLARGVDYIQAYIWWKLAATQGYEDANHNLEFIRTQMEPSQIRQADRLFVEKFFPGIEVR